jgi:hypothetical protein
MVLQAVLPPNPSATTIFSIFIFKIFQKINKLYRLLSVFNEPTKPVTFHKNQPVFIHILIHANEAAAISRECDVVVVRK